MSRKSTLPALLAADARHQAVLEHPQQLHLHGERHVRDFVEEQGAAVGLLEDASSGSHRTGEGASLVAEELGFKQGLRDRTTVDGDEGPFLPGKGQRVQPLGDFLLAHAGLAGDDRMRRIGGDLVERRLHVAHGAGYAENRRPGRFLDGSLAGRTVRVDLAEQILDVERLGDVVHRAELEQRHRSVNRSESGDEDGRRHRRYGLVQGLEQLASGPVRQAVVADEHVVACPGDRRPCTSGGFVPIHGESFEFQPVAQRLAHDRIVFDDAERLVSTLHFSPACPVRSRVVAPPCADRQDHRPHVHCPPSVAGSSTRNRVRPGRLSTVSSPLNCCTI